MKAQKFLKVYHCNLFQYLVVVLVCSYSRSKVVTCTCLHFTITMGL